MQIGWIGLGVMGFPMAGHLARQGGHNVCVFNRTPEKARKWVEIYGGSIGKTPAEVARGADVVLSCVGNDADLLEVTLGEVGAFEAMAPGSVFIDHTTTSASVAKTLGQEAHRRELFFLDAPVSGGQIGAEKGILTIMCGGDSTVFSNVLPVLKGYSKHAALLGETGSGQLAKMCNQIALAGVVQGLSEAIHFGKKAGLDMVKTMETIEHGAAGSWQMSNRFRTMLAHQFDFGFAVDWMRKDLGLCLDEARRLGASLEVTALLDQFYAQVQRMGGGRWDTSSLLARLEESTKEE